MKKIITTICAVALFMGCKDNPISQKINEARESVSNATNAIEEVRENVTNAASAAGEMTDMQKDFEELAGKTPLTNDELKAWLPEKINGMKRIGYQTGKLGMMKIASIEGTYANEDKSKEFRIKVIDGAGETGAVLTAGQRMQFSQDFEEVTETKIRRTVSKNGKKAIEEYEKDNKKSSIQVMQGNRFYIQATGINMSLDETWEAIDGMNLDDLG